MFKWSGWNKYTRNKLNQIAGGGPGGVKFVPIYLTSNSGGSIVLTEDEEHEIRDGINSIRDGNIPYLDVSFPGGMVPSHSLFFYGHKETNPTVHTFVGGTQIAIFTGEKIIFAPIEQPKLGYAKQDYNIYWRRNGADVFATCETTRSSFTDSRILIPAYFKPDGQTYNIYVPIFNSTQNKMAGYVQVDSAYLYFNWFDDGAASTDRIAFSTNYRTRDSWLYPDL